MPKEIYLNAIVKYVDSTSEIEIFIKIGEPKETELDMLYVDEFFTSQKEFEVAVEKGTDELVIIEYWLTGQRKEIPELKDRRLGSFIID